MRTRYITLAAGGVVLAVLAGTGLPSAPPPTLPPDPLIEANDIFRAIYKRAREDALARTGPVILAQGDELVLRYGVQRETARYTPAVYHTLKTVAHIPLAIHLLLDPATGRELDDNRLHDLRFLRDRALAVPPSLEQKGLSAEQLARQKQIVRQSVGLLDATLRARKIDEAALTAFRERLRPLIDANVAEAARAELDALHRQVLAWKGKLTAEDWARLRVIVIGSQMPRKDNLAVQYFARLLHEPGEGRRILYAEGLGDEQRALTLLGTHLLDTRIGEAFYGDPGRMHRDLLGDAARKHLDELFRGDRP
jgi:hypothetical protein